LRYNLQNAIQGVTRTANVLATAANVTGTLVVLLLVAVVNYDVFARGIFNTPFRGAVEVVQFSMVLIVFLQLPDVVRVNRLTRSDGFLILLAMRYPRVAQLLRRAIDLLSAIVMSLIAVAIWPEFVDMWQTQDYFGIPGVFVAPWWPLKLTIFASAALCTLIFLLKVVATRGAGNGDPAARNEKAAK
jgi:TRAP-type C4-dicarboxylate transport system permease small subunit